MDSISQQKGTIVSAPCQSALIDSGAAHVQLWANLKTGSDFDRA
jgi:hypothetical protein